MDISRNINEFSVDSLYDIAESKAVNSLMFDDYKIAIYPKLNINEQYMECCNNGVEHLVTVKFVSEAIGRQCRNN